MSFTSARPDQQYRPAGERELVDAPIWRRAVARIIDIPLFYGLAFVYVIPIAILLMPIYAINANVYANIGAGICIFLAMFVTEWLLLARRNGQTFGKGLLGLRVVRDTKQAEAYAYRTSAVRMVILLATFWLSGVTALFRRDRKGLHDLAAHTRVVRAPRRGISFKDDLLMAAPIPRRINLEKSSRTRKHL